MRRLARDLIFLALLALAVAPGCMSPRIRERPFRPRPPIDQAAWSPGLLGNGRGSAQQLEYAQFKTEVERPGGASPERILQLSDLAHKIGCRQAPRDPAVALPWFRDAAAYSMFALAAPGVAGNPVIEERAVTRHNEAVEWLLRCAGVDPKQDPPVWREQLASAGVEVVQTAPDRATIPLNELWLARDFGIRNLEMVDWPGLGVPLIAVSHFKHREAEPDRFHPPKLRIPATAVLKVEGSLEGGAWQAQPVRLALYDPARVSAIPVGGSAQPVPLAGDLTTPFGHQMISRVLTQLAWGGLLRPESYSSEPGIFMQGPYQAGKIPVLFVHGLWSSPDVWLVMANKLQEDPEIRKTYQFWYAYYPTGAPIMSSAIRLRKALKELRESIDPSGSDPALNQMVAVGHSLGGVLSKQLLQKSDQRLERGLFTRPFSEVAMSPETRQKLTMFFNFEPLPYIRRVVFIAAPHRGSNTAQQLLGRFGSAMVREPGEFSQMHAEVVALNGSEVLQPFYRRRPPNSIDNLSWESPILKALSQLPINPGVPYHSVVANLFPDAPPRFWTDGVVSYESAHIEGAASEIMIRHNHFANDTPEATAEVYRILKLHKVELGAFSPSSQEVAVGAESIESR